MPRVVAHDAVLVPCLASLATDLQWCSFNPISSPVTIWKCRADSTEQYSAVHAVVWLIPPQVLADLLLIDRSRILRMNTNCWRNLVEWWSCLAQQSQASRTSCTQGGNAGMLRQKYARCAVD